jgi:hypothetical protein
MIITRIYTGEDHQSHFENLEIPLKEGGKGGFMSELMTQESCCGRKAEKIVVYYFRLMILQALLLKSLRAEFHFSLFKGEWTRKICPPCIKED